MSKLQFGKVAKRSQTALHVTGTALIFVSLMMLICSFVELSDNSSIYPLLISSLICGFVGSVARLTTKPGAMGQAEIFSAVGSAYLFVSLFGTLPYLFAGTFDLGNSDSLIEFTDALFESISGYTATGSTVFGSHNPIESHGTGILLYRQLTQWLGGLGIVVLVVTVLPSLRASGLGLISAEAPGPESDRLAARVVDLSLIHI